MSLENVAIENHLYVAGYKTERIDGVVNVYDPIHSSVAGSPVLVVTGWRLKEIPDIGKACSFIEERA